MVSKGNILLCVRAFRVKVRSFCFAAKYIIILGRDVLAIGRFGTIPERPVQSRPLRAGLSKIYFN